MSDTQSKMETRTPLTPVVIQGRISDEDGQPPQRCHFSLIRAGRRGERSGYICDSGSLEVDAQGRFSSPSLDPGRYFLRFTGLLRRPSHASLQEMPSGVQQRVFDFLYPNAVSLSEAHPSDVETGQTPAFLDVSIPRPVWCTVRGALKGAPPDDLENIFVHFARDIGTIDDLGSTGVKVDRNGDFESPVQPGRYQVSVCEMALPLPNGYMRITRILASTEMVVAASDVPDLEIQMPGAAT